DYVWSIDYSTFDDCQFICSGSNDKTFLYFVKFSSYHYHNHRQNVICSSSINDTIRFWDFKHNNQLQIFNGHTDIVNGVKFSPFNGGRYLCSGSNDKTIRLWDVETSKSLHVFNVHENIVYCVDISPPQSNNKDDNNKMNNIDKSVRLWDIRSGKQIQVFNGHKDYVFSVEYVPFIIKNNIISSNVNELHIIKGSEKEHDGILCLKFISLKKKNDKKNIEYNLNLCYGTCKGQIYICKKNKTECAISIVETTYLSASVYGRSCASTTNTSTLQYANISAGLTSGSLQSKLPGKSTI
ncbi:hypothetical protein RFI_00450, partial [Reticulomyxa filosa]